MKPDSEPSVTVLVAKVGGYGSLSHRDEQLTLELLNEHQLTISEMLAALGGQSIQATSAAIVAHFDHASLAAGAAIELITHMRRRNGVVANERRLSLQIGIHAAPGALVPEPTLRVAHSLAGIAAAGGICVSAAAAKALGGRRPILEPMGLSRLDAASPPLEVLRLRLPWERRVARGRRSWARVVTQVTLVALVALGVGLSVALYRAGHLPRPAAVAVSAPVPVLAAPPPALAAGTAAATCPESLNKGLMLLRHGSAADLVAAVALLRGAADAAPACAAAHLGLAEGYVRLAVNGTDRSASFERADAAVSRALALADDVAAAHALAATLARRVDFDWRRSEASLQKALEIAPDDLAAHLERALLFTTLGEPVKAMTEVESARALDPLSAATLTTVAQIGNLTRNPTIAVDAARQALALDPLGAAATAELALAHLHLDKLSEASALAHRAAKLAPDRPRYAGILGVALARAAETSRAREVLATLTNHSADRPEAATSIAWIYAALGETDEAGGWLMKACEAKDDGALYLRLDPLFDSLRPTAGFASAEACMNLRR
ncbi:MAG: hypothetical protein HY903_18535 [Deltaproteobacteria bacterium]|nr:hypothetical protein [Deltaproteobacteria bacterium]